MKQGSQRLKIAENPLAGGGFLNWLHLLRDNRPVQRRYTFRAVYITIMTLLFLPLRLLHRFLYNRKIRNTQIGKEPVFILGHFRCGGTHLMNLLTQDEQWAFISTTQALLPELYLLGRPIRNIFKLFLHEKRPMDNLRVTPESPEEPEHAIGNLIPYGFYQGLCFPDRMMEYFRQSVTFEKDDEGKIRQMWAGSLLKIMKTCSLANPGRQLLIKNPPDMARIPHLLMLFPNARFIFLYRNPFVLFPSIKNFLTAYIRDWQLRDISDEKLDRNILEFYEVLSQYYQRDKDLIPEGRLVEVCFEDIEKEPLQELRRIYEKLKFSGFDKAEEHFREYIRLQKDYKKNRYTLTQDQIDLIRGKWGADITRWSYSPDGMISEQFT